MTRAERLAAKRARKRRPSPAIVISIIALVMAMSGGAYAATQINGNQIQWGTVPVRALSNHARSVLKGNQGPQGPAGVNGTKGANGTNGTDGVVSTVTVNHTVNGTTLGLGYTYLGAPNTVNVTAGQKITGSVTASLGSTGGATARLSLCYSQGGALSNFSGNLFFGSTVTITPTRLPYTASESVSGLAAGTYIVGFCGSGFGTVDNNGSAVGWFISTN